MSVFTTATARKIVSVSLEHEMRNAFDVVALSGPRRALELALIDLKITPFKVTDLKDSEFRVEDSQRLAYAVVPTSPHLGEVFLNRLLSDSDFVEAMRVLLEVDEQKWITSEAASQILGFSRTYTNALLDSEDFEGNVRRTDGGHRRVSQKALYEWKEMHPAPERSDVRLARQALRAELSLEGTLGGPRSADEEARRPAAVSKKNAKLQKAREEVLANFVERP